MKKLPLNQLELEALNNMIESSTMYYANLVKKTESIYELCGAQLQYEAVLSIQKMVFQAIYDAKKSNCHILTNISLTATQALVFLASIIPPNNLTYADNVKQIVTDYCIDILKEVGVIPNNPTYKPSEIITPRELLPYANK